MELKNALAVCLISFFSATLVLLIARSLDLQAAARLEPQLAAIVGELQAIRGQGRLAPETAQNAAPDHSSPIQDGVVVYYFHGATRCPTCRAIESQAHDVVQADFAAALAAGQLQWKVMNYEEGPGADLAEQFDVLASVVVLARVRQGEIADWKRLDRVWSLVDDTPAYAAFMRDEIHQMLESPAPASPPAESPGEEERSSSELPDIPVPAAGAIPLPE